MEVTSSIYLDQWFSTSSGFASQGTVGSIWRNLWLAQLGGWSWHLVDRSQESYSTFYSAQDRSSETKNYSAQNVQNANVEKLWSRSPYIYAFLKLHQPLSSRANSWVFEFLFIDWFIVSCAGSWLPCRLISSCGEWGLLSSCCSRFSRRWLLLLGSTASRTRGLQQPGHTGSVVASPRLPSTGSAAVAHGLSCSGVCGIFLDWGLNHVSCPGRQILYHWATRETQEFMFWCFILLALLASDFLIVFGLQAHFQWKILLLWGFPGSSADKESTCNAGDWPPLDFWIRKFPQKRDRLPTPAFTGFPGGSDGKESACNSGPI